MRHLGDITKINGAEIEPVDVITFGSPCQDLSVAGKRAGLAGERSGLFMEAVRIIKEMRYATDGIYPNFAVWENVPGAFSSNKGEDFRAVLEEFVRIVEPGAAIPQPPNGKWRNSGRIVGNRWSLAWRILDAQFWGVPQRRRRIALVMDFGGQSAPEILFVRKGMSRDSAPGTKARKRIARNIADCFGTAGGGKTITFGIGGYNSEGMKSMNPHAGIYIAKTSRTLDLNGGNPACNQGGIAICEPVKLYESHPQDSRIKEILDGISPTVSVKFAKGAADTPLICEPEIARTLTARFDSSPCADRGQNIVAVAVHQNADGEVRAGNVANTLNTNSNASGRNAPLVAVYDARGNGDGLTVPTMTGDHQNRITDYTGIVCMAHGQANAEIAQDVSPTLNCNHEQPIVAFQNTGRGWWNQSDVAQCLRTPCGGDSTKANLIADADYSHAVRIRYRVRRLTPLECERLQGYPDGWTLIPDYIDGNGKKHTVSDSNRYKALGNSIALPPWKWVLKRISAQFERDATLGSLFDGIGGFPLIWERLNGAGTARWASEIESFPIAVTKYWFSQE